MAGKPEKKEQQHIFFSILDLNGTAKTFELRLKEKSMQVKVVFTIKNYYKEKLHNKN